MIADEKRNAEIYAVGIATGDVTPPVGIPLCGFADRTIHCSTGVYHPLRAVAVVVDDGETPILLVSVEWLGFYDLTRRVRERLSRVTGIPPAQIVLSGTHTHCGPAVRDGDAKVHGWIDHAYIESAIETLAAISERAWKLRYPATLKFGTAHCSLAMNRRIPDPEHPGRVLRAMTPNPDGASDHEVPIMVIENNGFIRGVLFSYACHPTSRAGLLIGGDFAAFACDYVQEAILDSQPMFLQGCAGDQKPRPVDPASRSFGQRSVEQVQEIGYELGEAVVSAIREGALEPVTGPLEARQQIITLQTEPLDKQAVQEALNDPTAASYKKEWARYHQDRMDKGLPEVRDVPFEIQTIRFGDSLAIVTLAAEMSVEYSLRLKEELRRHFRHVLPMAYTNDIVGYVPVKRQFSEFGYEVLDANQHAYAVESSPPRMGPRTGRYVPETEGQIHATVYALLGVGAGQTDGKQNCPKMKHGPRI